MTLKLFVYISCYQFGMNISQIPLSGVILGFLGYVGAEFYLMVMNRNEIIRGDPITRINLISNDILPNTLFIDSNLSLYAITGILFFSTVETEDYLDRMRLQDQFSIIHIESLDLKLHILLHGKDYFHRHLSTFFRALDKIVEHRLQGHVLNTLHQQSMNIPAHRCICNILDLSKE